MRVALAQQVDARRCDAVARLTIQRIGSCTVIVIVKGVNGKDRTGQDRTGQDRAE